MITNILLIVTILLSAICILILVKQKHPSFINYIISFLIFIICYFCGGWIYLSLYLKYIFLIAFIITSLFYFARYQRGNKSGIFNYTWKFFIIILLIIPEYNYFTSRIYHSESINLNFPMKDGKYNIIMGGSNKFVNFIHYNTSFSIYAYDIVKLNSLGSRANTIFPKALEDYEIYGKKIYSPCAGKIISIDKNIPDNVPNELNGKERAGNYVIIQNENRFIMLAHLRPNSIKINKYDSVKVNDYIGEAGNSGYSIEPHLHIEVHEQISSNTIPVSIMFDNEFYTYNDVIKR